MFYFKFILLVGSLGFSLLLVVSATMNLIDAWNSPYQVSIQGKVIQDVPGPSSGEAIAPGGGQVIVEFQDSTGQPRREAFGRYNSAGKTVFSDKQIGDPVEFMMTVQEPVEGAVRYFRWDDVSKVLLMFGVLVALVGAALRFL